MAALPSEFRDHQRRVRAILQDAQPWLQPDSEYGWLELAAMRPHLQQALTAYQRYKHDELYDPAITIGGEGATLARSLKVQCIGLGIKYEEFAQLWPSTRVANDWPGYQAAARGMFTTLQVGLREEAKLVLDLVVRR